ncbi:S100P-binding protein isoform X3 [Natator depressus]|uniref:S100P-binding protein isoform X3 n=1 Tax=Natator depressus TaxID=27790 RepID=UPI003EB98C80
MEDSSPHSSGLGVYPNHKVTLVNDTIHRTKRPLDLLEEDQPLQSAAKKRCHLSNYCSTPCPSKKLPLCSPDSACFPGCLDDTELENIVIRVCLPEDSAVALSVDTTRCFDDSEPDDSLLEPSDDEQGNSPFNYTEEECREMLADDCLGDDQNSTGESALVTLDVWGQSEKEVSSNCSWASVPPEGTETSFRTIDELLNSVVLNQDCGEDTTCGKKLGKVIPVPQVEERPKQRICISEAELEQKKCIYIQCVRAHVKNSMDPTPDALNELYALMDKVASREYRTQDRRWQHPSDLTMRKYPRFSKKPTQKCSLKQWVSRNLAHHRRFQDIPDHFQRSSVTTSSNV